VLSAIRTVTSGSGLGSVIRCVDRCFRWVKVKSTNTITSITTKREINDINLSTDKQEINYKESIQES
jgi:hypothetical protein